MKPPNMSPVDAARATDWSVKVQAALSSVDGLHALWLAVSNLERGHWVIASGDAVVSGAAATVTDHNQIGS